MTTQTLPGTTLRLSAFCYGTADLGATVRGTAADRLINAFRDAGGNFLDTAHVYACWTAAGAGSSERAIADYFRRNGGRDQMIVATKGGHMPFASYVHPEHYLSAAAIASDISDSLARLAAGVLDFYWLHRDDPRLPVAEIIETMNAEIRHGRIRYIGASNWPVARIAAANDYARAHGLQGFVAAQPQWSLAHVTENPLQTVFLDHAAVDWHCRSGLPVIPYSPTARGFFASGKASKAFDNELTRQRRARAGTLATQLGCTPNQIALAYLRAHAFPVIPILGTLNLDHLRDGLGAANVMLTAAQAAWLRDGGAH